MDRARANSLSARGMFMLVAPAVHRGSRDVHVRGIFAEPALKRRCFMHAPKVQGTAVSARHDEPSGGSAADRAYSLNVIDRSMSAAHCFAWLRMSWASHAGWVAGSPVMFLSILS